MKRKELWRYSALVAVFAVCVTLALAEGQATDLDAQMQEMMKYAVPNEHHGHLKALEGSWDTRAKMWMQPGAPATESQGQTVNTLLLGGRFLRSEFTGNVMGMPFNGIGIEGYDAFQKKHIGVWIDNMGTMMMQFEGSCEQDGKVQTMRSNFVMPGGGEMTMKSITKVHGPNKYTFEAWQGPAGGELNKVMEITYTRI